MNTYAVITQAIGIIAMAMNIFSFQCKKTRNFYMMQACGGILFAFNYIMLGMYTGAITNIVNLLRSAVMSGGKKTRKWYFFVLVAGAYVAATLFTYAGWLSIIILVAQLVGVSTMWTDNGKIIRIGQFFAVSPLWLIYNIAAGSIGGIICEIFTFVSVIVYAARCILPKMIKERNGVQ